MKRVSRLVVLFAVFAIPLAAGDVSPDDRKGIETAIGYYFEGHAKGSGDAMRKAFAPEAQLFWIADSALKTRTSEDFAAAFKGNVAQDEAQRKRTIELIDVAGDVAIAKVVLDYPAVKFTDYMSLAKVGGEWKIVNKTYFADRKKP
ncbi:MAG TPA: nuclear transport factor 2 family protein [Thermoanaerobaculia bacterium]